MAELKKNVYIQQDRGWGWLVVTAAFIAHVITHGILYSFGVLFLALHDKFNGNKSEIAWVGALANGTVYLIGPVAGYLATRFGRRLVTTLGATIGALGYILSAFAPNLYVLYITMGILAGSGFGMVFFTAIVTVTQCFSKYRSIACGIAISGAGSGAFIFSPMIKMLLDTFALQGTLLILGGISLNCIPCGLIFHRARRTRANRTHRASDVTTEKLETAERNVHVTHQEVDLSDEYTNAIESHVIKDLSECEAKSPYRNNDTTDSKVNEYSKTTTENHSVVLDSKVNEMKQFDVLDKTEHSKIEKKTQFIDHFIVFKSKIFVLFAISQFLFFFGFYLPFIYIPDKAKLAGIDENSVVWVVSTIGLSSIVSRVGLGYVADRPNVDRLLVFKIALLMTGISTSLCPALTTLWSLFIYAVVFGMATGITLSLTSVVLVDLLGMDRLTDAFGMNNLLTGVATLLGPPLAGFLFDATRKYDASFITAGTVMTAGGLLMFLTPCVIKSDSKKDLAIYVTTLEKKTDL